MKRKRLSEEQIIGILKESEAGAKTKDLCCKRTSPRSVNAIRSSATAGRLT